LTAVRYILGGHWRESEPGYTILTEEQCDITKPLPFEDNSVDEIFTEHVIEHVSLIDALGFFREALRVLKPCGKFVCVAPMLDRFLDADGDYLEQSIRPWYWEELDELEAAGVDLRKSSWLALMAHSLYTKHGHQFIWTERFMVDVLFGVGFQAYNIGEGEPSPPPPPARLTRGGASFDPESGWVEARKP